ncbi:MAG TPA: pirin family protein [Hyphomicrobium sp.]|nr:pirin family protein [Hyphomicrobium sp.]
MRSITAVFNAPRPHWVGDGFPVRSLLSHHEHGAAISPFLLLDHAGPYAFEPARHRRGVGEHPHRGFETVTLVYSGEVEHRDSSGGGGIIGPGDVQWMTASSGLVHEEFHSGAFTASGGVFEVVQLWVNLPAKDKSAAPGYQPLESAHIPMVALPEEAGSVRVIAGEYAGRTGPARTFTPIGIFDVRLAGGGSAQFAPPGEHTAMLAVLSGAVMVNGEVIVRGGQIVAFAREAGSLHVEANNDAKLLLLTGEPIDEPVAAYGPFVMNTAEEIQQAIEEFRAGKFGALAD